MVYKNWPVLFVAPERDGRNGGRVTSEYTVTIPSQFIFKAAKTHKELQNL